MKALLKSLSLAIILLLIFSGWGAAEITIGPYLQPTADMETSVGIAWRSTNSVPGTVNYGVSSISEGTESTSAGTIHYVLLDGLTAGTTYKYQVVCDGTTSTEYSFRTSTDTAERRFIVLSDVHAVGGTTDGWATQQPHWMPDMASFDPDVIVFTGDFVNTGSDESEYLTLFTIYRDLFATAIVAPLPGNHEYVYDVGLPVYKSYFTLPANCAGNEEKSYYMDYGGIRWVMLGSNSMYTIPWVESSLTAPSANFVLAGKHHPVYLSFSYDDEMAGNITDESWKQALRDSLETKNADMLFSGHRHIYHRSFPMLKDLTTPATSPACGNGWGGPETSEAVNYADPAGVIHVELQSLYYEKSGTIYERAPIMAATGNDNGYSSQEWLGFTTLVVNSKVLTMDTYSYSRDGAVKHQQIDHFVLDKSSLASVSGRITDGGAGLAGVEVTADGTHTATTNGNGDYSIPGLADGTYTIEPTKLGYTFTPVTRSAVITSNTDVTGVDFTAVNTGGTVTFQNGSSGYAGQIDCFIDSSSMEDYHDSGGMLHLRLDDAASQEAFFQWDLSSIPTDATVTAASVTIWVYRSSMSTNTGSVFKLNETWTEASAFSHLNTISKTDLSFDFTFSRTGGDTTLAPPQELVVTFAAGTPLDMIQNWVANPAQNFGISLDAEDSDIRVLSAEHGDAQYCPRITVEYISGGGTDTDGDGMPDDWETAHGLNPNTDDSAGNPDNDGLTNLQEYQNDTDPQDSDSDDDGLNDGYEVNTSSTDPNTADSDGDGLSDGYEVNTSTTDPNDSDDDDDGLTDGEEVNTHGTNPKSSDSDGDGMDDKWEVDHGLDPNTDDADIDSDGDNLDNIDEYGLGTDPDNIDTDGDGDPDDTDPQPLVYNGAGTEGGTQGGCQPGRSNPVFIVLLSLFYLLTISGRVNLK